MQSKYQQSKTHAHVEILWLNAQLFFPPSFPFTSW